ncbi:hypothetical protein [Iodidimonas sp. SYSU 1G8]|uniref:hypothetical protein n=1 Tax=Iodidimonas sp. SYSU 1G8 TaxID=3133967 RepID=UPI0031FE880B
MNSVTISKNLPPVRMGRAEFEQLVALIADEFSPDPVKIRIKDSSGLSTIRANDPAEFLANPGLSPSLHMVSITARDSTKRPEGQRRILVNLYNSGPGVFVEADSPYWAESAAGTIYDFLSKHRPWHFPMDGLIGAGLLGLALGAILLFGVRLLYRIATWNVTPDLVVTSLAIIAGSFAVAVTALLPGIEIRTGPRADPLVVKMERAIRISAAISVLLFGIGQLI